MAKRNASSLVPKINVILSITLESIVPDLRPLAAALFLSTPDEEIRIRNCYPEGHIIFLALDAVHDFRTDDTLRDLYISEGFFNEQLEHLLGIARKNRAAGARLMPIFCAALNDAEELKIPEKLQERIITHIEWQRKKDGFAITELSQARSVIVPADDVIPK